MKLWTRRTVASAAETIAIITRRSMKAVFFTDDHDAARRAAAESQINVASTTKILAFAEIKEPVLHDDFLAATRLTTVRSSRRRPTGSMGRSWLGRGR